MTLIVESTLPGVTAIINSGRVASPIAQQPTSTFFVVGWTPWGPANVPTIVTSYADFARQFMGGASGFHANSYVDDALHAFFNLFSGKQAVVVRVVGPAKTLGTLTLKDRSTSPGVNTLRVDAKYYSAAADLSVTVENGTNANTFKLTIESLYVEGGRKEIFDNLTLADATTITYVNQNSKLVNLTDLASVTAAPNNNPKVLAKTALAAGVDDFASLVASDYVGAAGPPKTGLQALTDESWGTGQVAIPGITDETTHAAIIAHAAAYHRLALIDPPLGSTKADMATSRALYGTWYGALYWTWQKAVAFDGSGVTKFYPPSGFIAGACAEVDHTIGVHKAPANMVVPGVIDVERLSGGQSHIDDATREYLNGLDVNVIAPLPNQGIKIYGARVMTADRRVQFVHEIRLLNELYYAGKLGLQWAVFQVVDGTGRLFRDIRTASESFLRRYYQAGALYGKTEKEAFIVICDESNNPPEELALGRVHVQWGVRISQTSEIIILNIDNVPLIQDVSVLQ